MTREQSSRARPIFEEAQRNPGLSAVVTLHAQAHAAGTPNHGPLRLDPAMLELQRLVERLASRKISVLVLGETGTGKELIAHELHQRSERAQRPFKVVNCAAIPETLIESVFFGHVRGSFTGAHRDQIGVFAQAHGGTLFLDEVGELSATAQAALLRVLDTRTVCAIGSHYDQSIDVRVVAATHRDLAAMTAQGSFRLDLYHRLNGVELRVPALRERRAEILPLFEHFMAQSLPSFERSPTLSSRAAERLLAYEWPGNVRELRNVVERALALCEGDSIDVHDLPQPIALAAASCAKPPSTTPGCTECEPPPAPEQGPSLRAALRAQEAALIEEALRETGGNQRLAAQRLRVPLRTLERKLMLLRIRAKPI